MGDFGSIKIEEVKILLKDVIGGWRGGVKGEYNFAIIFFMEDE